jgi:hypothetical protein
VLVISGRWHYTLASTFRFVTSMCGMWEEVGGKLGYTSRIKYGKFNTIFAEVLIFRSCHCRRID